MWYLAGFPDEALWDRVIAMAAETTGLTLHPLPDGLRKRETARQVFLINYNADPVEWDGHRIAGCDVLILKRARPERI